jgi:GT2 family glycosyltransferase
LGTSAPSGTISLDRKLILIESTENLGFAGGCNIGIRAAIAGGAEFIWLLNNDTEIRPDCLDILVSFLRNHPAIAGVTPKIHTSDNQIWNCGGHLTWYGGRKYDLCYQPLEAAPRSGWKEISFVTGCAALFRTRLFTEFGLLTERFFFGEEDIEFCRRVWRKGARFACVYDAVITHKVSQSTDRIHGSGGLGKIYIYYVNRLIAMRGEWPLAIWWSWRLLYSVYIAWIVRRRYHVSSAVTGRFLHRLAVDSTRLRGVNREDFQRMVRLTFE